MELQFDKEIDAMLRKARDAGAVAGTAVASAHVDADAIAAFAENVLPQKAKLLYTEHFADCDRCRQMLSQMIRLNTEAVAATASPVSAPQAKTALSWYQKLFKTQNMALAMGALVIGFSGILGYIAFQNRATNSVSVSQVSDTQDKRGGPYVPGDVPSAMSNTSSVASNSAANAAAPGAAAPSPVSSSTSALANTSAPSSTAAGQPGAAPELKSAADCKDCGTATGGAADDKPKSASPAPAAKDESPAGRDAAQTETRDRSADEVGLARKKADEPRNDRESNASKIAGPSRATGPRNVQQQQQSNDVFGMITAPKTIGGKSFENRNGAWYDSAYHGQATTDVRRGTEAYKKLDRGLRSIADSLGGTVVMVWKDKAYRIQ
jgi:hypothetical protein